MTTANETEVKIPVASVSEVLGKIENAGFRISVSRVFESNTLYDTPDRDLHRQGSILRLRRVGDKALITWKGRDQPGPHKVRQELETSVGSAEVLQQILKHLAYERVFRYEKYRTEFRSQTAASIGVVTLDETPIGNFLEIEGPGDWIDETAQKLGFSRADYVLSSYGGLYLEHCRKQGLEPSNMVFSSHD